MYNEWWIHLACYEVSVSSVFLNLFWYLWNILKAILSIQRNFNLTEYGEVVAKIHEYDYRWTWTTWSSVTKFIGTLTKFVINKALFLNLKEEIPLFQLAVKKKVIYSFNWWRVLSNYLDMTCTVLLICPIKAEIRAVGSQSDLRILL